MDDIPLNAKQKPDVASNPELSRLKEEEEIAYLKQKAKDRDDAQWWAQLKWYGAIVLFFLILFGLAAGIAYAIVVNITGPNEYYPYG